MNRRTVGIKQRGVYDSRSIDRTQGGATQRSIDTQGGATQRRIHML